MLEKFRDERTYRLSIALFIGIIFGFLLQKGGATEYEVIVGQLLLRDFTVLKIMFSAILTGMVGVYLLERFELAELSIKPFNIWPVVIGGLVFGVGFAILGYCPGTMAGALGSGSLHALIGIFGMLLGAGFYASSYQPLQKKFASKDLGNITIPGLLDINPWIVIPVLMLGLIAVLFFLERVGL